MSACLDVTLICEKGVIFHVSLLTLCACKGELIFVLNHAILCCPVLSLFCLYEVTASCFVHNIKHTST